MQELLNCSLNAFVSPCCYYECGHPCCHSSCRADDALPFARSAAVCDELSSTLQWSLSPYVMIGLLLVLEMLVAPLVYFHWRLAELRVHRKRTSFETCLSSTRGCNSRREALMGATPTMSGAAHPRSSLRRGSSAKDVESEMPRASRRASRDGSRHASRRASSRASRDGAPMPCVTVATRIGGWGKREGTLASKIKREPKRVAYASLLGVNLARILADLGEVGRSLDDTTPSDLHGIMAELAKGSKYLDEITQAALPSTCLEETRVLRDDVHLAIMSYRIAKRPYPTPMTVAALLSARWAWPAPSASAL